MGLEEILAQVTLFGHLSQEHLGALATRGEQCELEAGEVVCEEGQQAESMYVILAGQVKVYKSDVEGNEVELLRLGEGEFFGELGLLDRQPRSASVVTLEPSRFFVLHAQALRALLLEGPSQLTWEVLSALAGRVRETSQKYFDEELDNRLLQAEMEVQKHRSLAQMVAGVAHEINTPLGVAKLATGIITSRLHKGRLGELVAQEPKAKEVLADVMEAAGMLQKQIERAHHLIQNFKKISVNQLTDTWARVELVGLVSDIVELFSLNARKSALEISVEHTLTERIWEGYPGFLTQVVLNLLTNVERYAYAPGTGGKIDVALGEISHEESGQEARFRLTVRDYGAGIEAEALPRIFEAFYTTGRGIGGSGLGMAIVYNIVTSALQGEISIDSIPGQGTTCTVTFPQRLAE